MYLPQVWLQLVTHSNNKSKNGKKRFLKKMTCGKYKVRFPEIFLK